MSYSILYRSMFLKLKEDMFIPIYESGDSNVFNNETRKIPRDWCNTLFNGMNDIYCSESELLSILNDYHKRISKKYESEGYSDKSFGFYDLTRVYGKKNTSWNDFYNFIKKGFKNSITFEDANFLHISICISYYDENNKYYYNYVNSSDELISNINKIKDNGIKQMWVGYRNVSKESYDFINFIKNHKSNNGKWFIETSGGFLSSFEGSKPIFTNDINNVLTFKSNKDADKVGSFLIYKACFISSNLNITSVGYREKK